MLCSSSSIQAFRGTGSWCKESVPVPGLAGRGSGTGHSERAGSYRCWNRAVEMQGSTRKLLEGLTLILILVLGFAWHVFNVEILNCKHSEKSEGGRMSAVGPPMQNDPIHNFLRTEGFALHLRSGMSACRSSGIKWQRMPSCCPDLSVSQAVGHYPVGRWKSKRLFFKAVTAAASSLPFTIEVKRKP